MRRLRIVLVFVGLISGMAAAPAVPCLTCSEGNCVRCFEEEELAVSQVVLFSGGVDLGWSYLEDWNWANGGDRAEQGSMVVPSIASGHYQLCILSLLQLALTPDRSARSGCVDGYLAPLGELTLDLRAGSAAE